MELPSFSHLPTEIIVHIFYSLPSFSDVFSFAATCQHSRQVWQNNVNTIYNHVSPRTIQCRCSARTLLADQGGAPADSALTVPDVLLLLRNASMMEKSIDQFNTYFVARVFLKTHPTHYKYFGGQPRPPYMTRTERPRFIRTVYKIWSLLLLDPVARAERFKGFKLKDMHAILDLLRGCKPISIYDRTAMSLLQADHGLFHQILHELVPIMQRVVIQAHDCDEIWEYISPSETVTSGFEGVRLVPVEDLWDDTDDEDVWD